MKDANRIRVPAFQASRAKLMRGAMTDPERRLWTAMRQRLPLRNTHFRRQVPIGPYIVDFCCLKARLVIEVDGNQHGTDDARKRDAERSEAIEAQRFRVIRFSNEDVMRSLDAVLDTILAALMDRLAEMERLEGPPPLAPPRKGEGRLHV